MTSAQRAFVGAIFGATLALLFHPLSRPWLQYGFSGSRFSPTVQSSPWLAGSLDELPPPSTEAEVSLWTQIAARKVLSQDGPDRDDLLLVAELVRMASEKDPRNAYWRQCEAVFQDLLHNDEAAKRAWQRASVRPYWSDYQPDRVKKFLSKMREESHGEMAWHAAIAYQLSSSDCSELIRRYGQKTLLADSSMEERWVTFQNGHLLRDGARLRKAAENGHALIELAAIGASDSSRPRDVTTNRLNFALDWAKSQRDTRAQIALRTLKENEAYSALVFASGIDVEFSRDVALAAAVASLPGSLTFIAIVSAALLLVTWLLRSVRMPVVPLAVPLVASFVLGLVAYMITRDVLVSLWILLVVGLFAARPAVVLQTPANLKPSAWLGAVAFGGLFAAFASLVWMTRSVPFRSVSSAFPVGWWDRPYITLGYGLVALAGLFMIYGQAVAFRTRRRAGDTCLRLAHRAFAASAIGCLFCAAIATPICILWDRQVGKTLHMIALNETGYYLTR